MWKKYDGTCGLNGCNCDETSIYSHMKVNQKRDVKASFTVTTYL